ncbi:hypothetical protein DOM21_14925 [Bacteriovorax stolpii]|uniref:hypothetical protein n=1 Tax=Bacteriovorax stolpii TaxID=960 RepID=UPI00115A75F7|nr:hypothetical protein [Bacteriovorax stolpii]QDK42720.1 hypothetical protein DOM21_14925 [Bacteriovorax stolpii]
MKDLLKNIEELIAKIGKEEFKKNPKASAKALEIKRMISELKVNVTKPNAQNLGVLKYISPKALLEN